MNLIRNMDASKTRYRGKKVFMRTNSVLVFSFLFMAALSAAAQLPSTGPAPMTESQSPALNSPQMPSMDSFNGSGVVDKLVPGVVKLSLLDAIDRGIKHNLGLLLSQQQSDSARAEYRRQLSALLPNVSGNVSDSVNQINLAAFGIPLPAGLTSPVVGPFGVFDAHASASETLLDFSAMNKVRAATENEKAAKLTIQDARELVVLIVGNQYLLTVASAARLDTAKAQLNTAQTIFGQTKDLKAAGVAAGIDVLRSQVQMQTQQQRVLAAQNQYEQQKMGFARTIGMAVSQPFELTDAVPYPPTAPVDFDQALALAYKQRPEYLAAESRVRSAELAVKAARGEALPTVALNGQVGYIGPSPGNSDVTYALSAGVRVPIFQGGKVKADVDQAETQLRQNRLQLANLRSRVEFEIRSALLDVKTSDDQVAVARDQIELAGEQLKESQDRYKAGVSGSLEVVQSQEAVASANDSYIQALYQNNVAKLTLVRALGEAEQRTRAFLGGK
ncbi:MAG TPA: TolC family protein [Candidatus Angelobacter sp.]|nr:TolC family protein [Candidatus Angelobacter sp.]